MTGDKPQAVKDSKEKPGSKVASKLPANKPLARPQIACRSKYYVHDVPNGLYLLKSDIKDIENGKELSDDAVVFFKRLLWLQFYRFKVISSAELFVSQEFLLERAQEHAQILHDVERGHWILAYRCAKGVFVLDPLWV